MKEIFTSNRNLKFVEIVLLFIVAPIILLLSIPTMYKVTYVLIGVFYMMLISIFIEKFQKKNIGKKLRKTVGKQIGIRFLTITLLTTIVLYFQDKELLFNVVLNKPVLWLKFSGIYILFSVIPQELIYRTFFVKRYQKLLNKEWLFILINSLLFSFGHIWFQSWIVLGFTFIGSILFVTTYLKTKSIWIVFLEHSLYGVWLYTVGYGELFMFPI